VLKGHDDHVITCLQFSGNRIVSGSDDNTLKVQIVRLFYQLVPEYELFRGGGLKVGKKEEKKANLRKKTNEIIKGKLVEQSKDGGEEIGFPDPNPAGSVTFGLPRCRSGLFFRISC
jgi:hypothetical protein